MNELDLVLLEQKLKIHKSIGIISDTKHVPLISDIISRIKEIDSSIDVRILPIAEIACRIKSKIFPFYILLCLECPYHRFKDSIRIQKVEAPQIQDNVICDSYHSKKNEIVNIPLTCDICTESQQFYDYFFYTSDSNPTNSKIIKKDKMRFLISRMARMDKIKEKKVFGIFFTSPHYYQLAQEIETFLISKGKGTILVFLKEVNVDRLIAIEQVDIVVVIDCPFFTYFDLPMHITLVTPFELAQAYKNSWNGEYLINDFNIVDNMIDEEVDLNQECYGLMTLKPTYDFEYEVEGEDTKIHMGKSGIPTSYKRVDDK